MSVKYILGQAGAKMGLNPNAQSSRLVLLRFLNEAARELYNQSDMPGCLLEQVFKVNGDQTISCPEYVGRIRGLREFNSQIPWSLNQMRPRYNKFNWQDMWRNIRFKNRQALMTTVTNQSVGVLTVPVVESPPVVVTVSGPTPTASELSEDITMSAVTAQTVNNFLDYTSVKKDRVNNYDITLSDIDAKVLTVIPNNMLTASYQIIDISLCPWLPTGLAPQEHYVELLYKKTLPYLSNDADEFPAQGYDDVIVNKMMQLWFEEQGKPDVAIAYDTKATRTLARETEEQNRATEDVVSMVSNPHDTLLLKIRVARRRYYRGYFSRGYGY
jgi:hypothetical protein